MNFFSLLFSLLGVAFSASAVQMPDTPARYSMENTRSELMHSPDNGDYRILTSWPDAPAPASGWPIIYLLDGNSYFATATSMLRAQSCQRCALQPGVIVAIDYDGPSRRDRDYRPAVEQLTLESNPLGGTYPPGTPGEADQFLDFIQRELKPHVERNLPIDRQRQALFGHSYGGLFTLHTLFTRPDAFQRYAAASPSVWWNDRYILREADAFIASLRNRPLEYPIALTISVGEFEQSLERGEMQLPAKERTPLAMHRGQRRMVDNTRELVWLLEDARLVAFDVNHQIYAGQNHKTAPPFSLQQALAEHFRR